MALIDKASLLMVPSTYEAGKLYNVLPSGNRAPDSTDQNSGYDQTRADFDFDRGSNAAATRIDENGVLQKYRENVLTESNNFSDSDWTKIRSSVSSGATDPFGGSNAWAFLTDTTADEQHYFSQSISQSGVGTLSIYAKANGYNWLRLRLPSEEAFFDLANGVTGSSTTGIIASMTDAGEGWYRCEVAISNMSTNPNVFIHIAEGDGDIFIGGTPSGTAGLYIYAAQLESGLVATDVLTSGATTAKAGVLVDMPRINFDANGENGSLLLEPSRSNLIQYSEYFGAWNKSTSAITITQNYGISPEGVKNSSRIEFTGPSQHINISTSLGVGVTSTGSVYIKGTAGETIQFDTGGAGALKTLSGDWQRIEVTSTSVSSLLLINTFNGATARDIEVYGAQVEANATYPSSYIPNHGESGGVTRAADSCSVTGASDVIGQTEGTVYLEFEIDNLSESGNEKVLFYMKDTGTGERYLSFVNNGSLTYIESNGAVIANISKTGLSVGSYKAAIAYKTNDFAFYLNGEQVGTDNAGTPSGFSTFGFQYYNAAVSGTQFTKQATLFKERLTNEELATLTTL